MPEDTLHILITYYDGQAEGDIGSPYYVASCPAIHGTTDGPTLEYLFKNLRELIALAFEGEDPIVAYNLIPNPRIVIQMELTDYAQIA